MAGHSKWANIKHRKGAQDAKRGKIFTKLIKEIQVATRMGGADIDSNPRLRDAITEARSNNMPKDKIENAIKRGSGSMDGENYEEITYEGYGPGGVALLIESLTDNRNRTVADVRFIVSKGGGSLGESGSVAWMFEKKGLIALNRKDIEEDKLMELALEAGAEDIKEEGDVWEVITPREEFHTVLTAIEGSNLKPVSSGISAIPKNTVKLEGDNVEKMLNLMEKLEDSDDVQKVYANFDISDEDLAKFGA